MRRVLALSAPLVAVAALIALPADAEAFGRRLRSRAACPPVVCVPVCPPAVLVPVERIVSAKTGRVHYLIDEGTVEDSHEKDVRPPIATGKGADPNVFTGKSRRVAKITIANAPVEDFPSVSALFTGAKRLKPDDEMEELNIPHGRGSEMSDRVAAEKRNLRVRAFLYHFSSQKDHDYHLIIGDPPGTPGQRFMNVEISGLPDEEDEPTAATMKALTSARAAFKAHFNLGNARKRKVVDPPIEVLVTGSAFWDAEHPPPRTVGPADFKPLSAWEIHPITEIVFDPE